MGVINRILPWNIPLHVAQKGTCNKKYVDSLTHWGRDNMDAMSQTTFLMHFLNEDIWIPIKISLKFVPKGLINNTPSLV